MNAETGLILLKVACGIFVFFTSFFSDGIDIPMHERILKSLFILLLFGLLLIILAFVGGELK